VVNEIHRQFDTVSMPPVAYHWRTNGGAEVDLLLERDGTFSPIEAKYRSRLTHHDTRGLRTFIKTYPHLNVAPGLIVYAGRECYRLNHYAFALPWNAVVRAGAAQTEQRPTA